MPKFLKPKNLLKWLAIIALTIGASITLGLLSMAGIIVFWPLMSVAIASFALAVVYESQIYRENIKNAFEKLFKSNYLQLEITRKFILKKFQANDDVDEAPRFFKYYHKQLKIIDKSSKRSKKLELAKLKDMNKYFAEIFFSKSDYKADSYKKEIKEWLESSEYQTFQKKYHEQKILFNIAKAFSILAGVFMSLGTAYLLTDVLVALPFIAILGPIPLGILLVSCGIAYTFLTYNTFTDMIKDEVVQKSWQSFKKNFKDINAKKVLHIIVDIFFKFLMPLTLTLFTAGTWWSIAKNARPLFKWIGDISSKITLYIMPVILSLAAGIFNLTNANESTAFLKRYFGNFKKNIKHKFEDFKTRLDNENWVQRLNPFSWLLSLTVNFLRNILFSAHVASIGMCTDRVPGLPNRYSAILSTVSEGIEDVHYFTGHDDNHSKNLFKKHLSGEHNHSHNNDIPTTLLKIIFSPIYFLAILWDCIGGMFNAKQHSFKKSCQKFDFIYDKKPACADKHKPEHGCDYKHESDHRDVSKPFIESTLQLRKYKITKYCKKLARKKIKKELVTSKINFFETAKELQFNKNNAKKVLNKHRGLGFGNTRSYKFHEELNKRFPRPMA